MFFLVAIFFLSFSSFSLSLSFEEKGDFEDNIIYTDVKVLGSYAFLVAGKDGIHIFDVSDINFPRKISIIESMNHSYDIDIKGFNLYVADGTAGVRIYDIRNKKKPKQISFIPTDKKSLELMVSGDYCFVAEAQGGFRLIDISKPTFPHEISSWDGLGYVNSIAVSHDYAFFASEKGVFYLLISNDPDSFDEYRKISEYGPVNNIVSNGRFLFASSVERGLLVAEISNVSYPLLQELPGKYSGIGDMFLSGFYLYVVRNGRLAVINMLVPFNPYFSGSVYTDTEISGVFIRDNLVYAACGMDGFRIFKISE